MKKPRTILKKLFILLNIALLSSFNFLLMSPNVLALPDTTPPVLDSLTFTPSSIDTSVAPAVVIVTATFHDTESGISSFGIQFSNNNNPRYAPFGGCGYVGNIKQLVCTVSLQFNPFIASGDWNAYVQILDSAGNNGAYTESDLATSGFPGKVHVISNNPDITKPSLDSLSISPASIDTSLAPGAVLINGTAHDDLSGISTFSVFFTNINVASGIRGSCVYPNYSIKVVCTTYAAFNKHRTHGDWTISV